MKFSRLALAAAAACPFFLAACGGGGSGEPIATAATPEGVYEGTLSGGAYSAFNMVYLEDGTYWAIYGNRSGGMLYVAGFSQGTATVSGNSFTSTNFKDFGYAPALAGSLSGSYVAGQSLSGAITAAGGAMAFSAAPISAAVIDYNAPATLANVAGAWNLTMLTGEATAATISSAGAISGRSSGGCSFSGSVAPRASGKNVYSVSITNGPSPCALPGAVLTGAAVYTANTNGTHNLIVLAVDGTRQYGAGAVGTR